MLFLLLINVPTMIEHDLLTLGICKLCMPVKYLSLQKAIYIISMGPKPLLKIDEDTGEREDHVSTDHFVWVYQVVPF